MEIDKDIEFYCYLKKNLKGKYSIVAIPLTSYYSEWIFEYHIFKDGRLFKQYKGDFRKIEKNSLIKEAKFLVFTAEGGEQI